MVIYHYIDNGKAMKLTPLKTRIFEKNKNIFDFFQEHYDINQLQENSVFVISSKIVALSQGRTSKKNLREEVISHADEILNDCGDFFLTVNEGIVIPNAGIDRSNSPSGEIILWPQDAEEEAILFKTHLQEITGIKNVGVIISDSRITPRRRGTVGVALAWSGIWGVKDERGKQDLFGRKLEVSSINIADNLSSAAEVLMGQANESTPFVCIEELSSTLFTNIQQHPDTAYISKSEDLFQY